MLNIGDTVVVIGKEEDYVAGVINHPSDYQLKETFGFVVNIHRFYGNHFQGKIVYVGKFNLYVIDSNGKYYLVDNKYNEIRKV
jgi:hypothetical protein